MRICLKSLSGKDGTLSFNNGTDRISKYLSMLNMGMLFDELSTDYLKRSGAEDILSGVPVPIAVDENGEMTTLTIALNMARVAGGDSGFVYADRYIEYIKHIAGTEACRMLVSEAATAADSGRYELACMYLRTALMIEPKSRDALYLYGRVCKECYESEDQDEDYVGNFKAESLEAFEILTMLHPDFAMGYYFLGYAYLNLGLYTKAELTWQDFMRLSMEEEKTQDREDERKELREEISERLESLRDPVIIEGACNRIMSGDYTGGKEILSGYKTGRYADWWPLWYYIGIAESALGNAGEAISCLKRALNLTPSNTDIMKELVSLYEATGDDENAEKYKRKIGIVQNNLAEEAAEESGQEA